jgi:hypothetical protein
MSTKKTYKQLYNEKYNKGKDVSNSKEKIARQTGISKRILDQVFDRGVGARKSNPESVRSLSGKKVGGKSLKGKMSASQWGYSRIYSFSMGGKTQKTADSDLWEKHLENVERKKKRKKVEK